jgi:hypothetical protein
MKYVPSLPPPAGGLEKRREVQALTRVKPARPVQSRTLPPQVIQPRREPQEIASKAAEELERREPAREERRKYCRRVSHQTMLEELRSGLERRRHKQRKRDPTEHIDEQA